MDWKKRMIQVLWLLLGAGTIVLFGAAMVHKNKLPCSDVKVEITGAEEHLFIDEKDVLELINSHANINNVQMNRVDLRAIETELEKTAWVKNAELFFDNKQVLQVKIEERQPIARVFTVQGESFYMDGTGVRLPLSDKLSARVPMFTNFPNDKQKMAESDSLLLQGVVKMGKYITADSFWRAQIEQVDITPQGTFELVPAVGDQIIVFGDADGIEDKFNVLFTFYKKAWLQNGINTYEKFDVRFKNQVVALKRGTEVLEADSAKAKAAINALMKGNVVLTADEKNPVASVQKDSISGVKSTNKPIIKNNFTNNHDLNNKKKNNSLYIVRKLKQPLEKGKIQPIKKKV